MPVSSHTLAFRLASSLSFSLSHILTVIFTLRNLADLWDVFSTDRDWVQSGSAKWTTQATFFMRKSVLMPVQPENK